MCWDIVNILYIFDHIVYYQYKLIMESNYQNKYNVEVILHLMLGCLTILTIQNKKFVPGQLIVNFVVDSRF